MEVAPTRKDNTYCINTVTSDHSHINLLVSNMLVNIHCWGEIKWKSWLITLAVRKSQFVNKAARININQELNKNYWWWIGVRINGLGCLFKRMDGGTDVLMEGWINVLMEGCIDRRMDQCIDGRMYWWKDGSMTNQSKISLKCESR